MECTFCGKTLPKGTGILYAKKDGTTFVFCSSKCKINFLEKKFKSHKTKWTNKYHVEKERHLKKK